ncbi:MAG: hypothetical protein PHC95_15085 [Parabacteroides sp.]|nr:hypothetical protein [Parabacteroides sp.]
MNSSKKLKNAQMNLEQFMATCKMEREAMTAAKEKADAEKRLSILRDLVTVFYFCPLIVQ